MSVVLKYFKPVEFTKCVPTCDISDMSDSFLLRLDRMRSISGVVCKLNSAFRSSAYDKAHGRTGRGFHTKGRAVDIDCRNSVSRSRIIAACREVGLSCGISKTFIHIDDRNIDDGYSEPIAFLY